MRTMLENARANNWHIMLPFNKVILKGNYGAGLYADRLYFVDKTTHELQALADGAISSFAKDLIKHSNCNDLDEDIIFLKSYLNLRIVEISLSDKQLKEITGSKDENGNSNNSVLKVLNDLLDNKELTKNYVFNYNENHLIDYFTTKWNQNTILKIDAFGEDNSRHFKSIAEIATSDLSSKTKQNQYNKLLELDFKNEDIQLIDELKKDGLFEDNFQDYHKYYAVLYADGDNITPLLKSVANNEIQLLTFSKKLLDFGIRAEKSINVNGGSAIYLGGEDILAFLPIAYNSGTELQSLAHLIKALDDDFMATLGEYSKEQNVTIPTLSYGLMLAYYKFPMQEAMRQAHELLEECKHNKKLFQVKNGVGIRFQKHSGQYMECFIDKGKITSSKIIYDLLTAQLKLNDKKDTLSGLIQRMKDDIFFTTFIYSIRNDRSDAFFENFFNEEVHKEKSTFIDSFNSLIKALKTDYLTDTTNRDEVESENKRFKDLLFTVLRYYQFIQPKKNKKHE